jgi:enoyl-CoA hydratase/carnithine racemase
MSQSRTTYKMSRGHTTVTSLEEYVDRYETVKLERRDGILQVTLHSDGGSLRWGATPQSEWIDAFAKIGEDADNRVVILTGVGPEFIGPVGTPATGPIRNPESWEEIRWEASAIIRNLLNIQVPMISAVNGPAYRHAELPLLSDIVLAAPEASFQDSGHFLSRTTPGDGMHTFMPLLMGTTRARYFLLTSQEITAEEAKEFGLVNEIVPRETLLPRAWELAEKLAEAPTLVLRHTRLLLTHHLRAKAHDLYELGLALEGHGSIARWIEENTDVRQDTAGQS